MSKHACGPDKFEVCSCGRPGYGTFGPNVYPQTAIGIEATFEFVEATNAGEQFTAGSAARAIGADQSPRHDTPKVGTVRKTLRLMEHLGYIERLTPIGDRRVLTVWERKATVGTAS